MRPKQNQLEILKQNRAFILRMRTIIKESESELTPLLKNKIESLILVAENHNNMLIDIYRGFEFDKLN